MIYWTRQTIVAFAAGGIFVGGMIPIIQNLATLDLPGMSAALLSSDGAPRGVARANGTILAVSVPSAAQDRVQRARAGEPVADTDGAGTPIPLASHSRGRDL